MDPETLAEIEPPANVLLVHANRDESDACDELRHEHGPTAELRVTFGDDRPNDPGPDDVERKLGLLTVGDASCTHGDATDLDFSDTVVAGSIRDPADLAEIGLAISRFCERWDDADERIAVCFDSLDAVLRSSSPKRVFQFTHVLTNRLASVDAHTHFHFDSTYHDDRLVSTFGTIFDSVIADEVAEDALSEATDEEVADLLAEWNDGESGIELEPNPAAEATDEDIARILGK